MYLIPQTHECPECGFQMNFSPSDHYRTPRVDYGHSILCPRCWEKFIKENVPVMHLIPGNKIRDSSSTPPP